MNKGNVQSAKIMKELRIVKHVGPISAVQDKKY